MSLTNAVLSDLFPEAQGTPGASVPVTGIASDSRKVRPGSVFVALPGTKADGMSFAAQAAAAGAAAVVGEGAAPGDLAVPFIRSADARRALALAAARFHPRQPEKVVAVTGTSGKSSVADFARQLFAGARPRRRRASERSVSSPRRAPPTGRSRRRIRFPFTRPSTACRRGGVERLAMEASSHGIDQRRLDGVRLAAGGFTNLGRDHLDYHGTTEAYAAAKLRLFDTLLPSDAPAVVNADGPFADVFLEGVRRRGLRLMTTGRAGETLRLVEGRAAGFGQQLTVEAYRAAHRSGSSASRGLSGRERAPRGGPRGGRRRRRPGPRRS